jgi:acyl dehydratase
MSTSSTALSFEAVQVGQQLPELRRTVTKEQIERYAKASGDHNPIHLDQTFARAAGLPSVIAHGLLTLSFAGQLVTDWLGDRARLRRLDARFAEMVLPGDEVRCSGTVSQKDEENRRVIVTLSAENQRGEKVLTKGIAEADFPQGA